MIQPRRNTGIPAGNETVRCRSADISRFRNHNNIASVTIGIRIRITFQAMPLRVGARLTVTDVVFMISSTPRAL